MPNFKTMPYRLRKRLVKAVSPRSRGWDTKFDKAWYRMFCGKAEAKTHFSKIADSAPWGESIDLSFLNANEKRAIVSRADEACRHEFDLLGSGLTHLGEEITWHSDFKSGYEWDVQQHYTGVRWGGLPLGVDIKVPWELSRCLHFSALGLADQITGDIKYYDEFKTQVRHWIALNPYPFGVNWACAMDVAMRAVNWINAAMILRERIENDHDDEFFEEFAEALWLAGRHVNRNLEWNGPRSIGAGNHLLADLTGLLGVGLFFRHTQLGMRWFKSAQAWLEREMFEQVNEDGSNFESSTYYHRMVHEMFQWSDSVADQSGLPFSVGYKNHLKKMREFVAAYSSPSGKAAQIGDNDSGRLLSAGIDDVTDHRYLMTGKVDTGGGIDHYMLMGDNEFTSDVGGGDFPDGGYYFGRQGEGWLGMRAGHILHRGGHAHCDQLAFVLSVRGNDFIVDRGTGIYTADSGLRNQLRSTESHNTLQVNGWEQCEFGSDRSQVFGMANSTETTVDKWIQGDSETSFVGCHDGYRRMRDGMVCRRAVCLKSRGLTIDDEISCLQEDDEVTWFLHLAPGVKLDIEGQQATLSSGGCHVAVRWDERLRGEACVVTHSSAYGVTEAATMLKINHRCSQDDEGKFNIRFSW